MSSRRLAAPLIALLLLLTTGLAGCIGTDDAPAATAADETAGAALTPCEHPWPCADGSEWPSELVTPTKHPRQPAELPAEIVPDGAEVLELGPEAATFQWTWGTTPAANVAVVGTADLRGTHEMPFTAPSGLFLRWTIDLELVGDDGLDGRSFDLYLYDADGESVCFTDIDLAVAGEPLPDSDTWTGCTTPVLQPLGDAEPWTVVLEHEWDRQGAEVLVTVGVELAEPQLGIELDRMEHVYVQSHDGTPLEGWIFHPDLPDGVKAPVVLHATPYIGVCNPGFNSLVIDGYSCGEMPHEGWSGAHWAIEPFVKNGYAVAVFSTRGTGGSGGCFGQHSLDEQLDYAHLTDWLGEQDWSNGRVGMYGLSYHGTTPFDAAIHAPEHLKTIVPAGIISDWYTFYVTPQGATHPITGWREVKYDYTVSLSRPSQSLLVHGDPSYAPILAERACADLVEHPASQSDWAVTDERHEAFFDERRLVDHFPEIEAAVFVVQGLLDAYGSGHAEQEDHIWHTLDNAPKRMLLGQWGHEFPWDTEQLDGAPVGADWHADVLVPWMDYWLKGVGDVSALGLDTVDYEDTDGTWRTTSAWPPAETREEVLYLAGDTLSPEPGSAGVTLQLSPDPQFCGSEGMGTVAFYPSEPLKEPVVLAGNPFALLELSSSGPSGAFDVIVLQLDGGTDTCQELFSDYGEEITFGGVDLRFHKGNFVGEDFPVDRPTPVRVDLFNQAWVVPAGHRLGVFITGDVSPWSERYPQLTLHPESHIVIPLVEGTLGGEAPTMEYPPRPFLPEGVGP